MTYKWDEMDELLGRKGVVIDLVEAGLLPKGVPFTDRHLTDARDYIKLSRDNKWSLTQVARYIETGEEPRTVRGKYTMKDLVKMTGVSGRTIRLWIEKGYVPRGRQPGDVNRWGVYDDTHVEAVRHLDRLRRSKPTLSEIASAAW